MSAGRPVKYTKDVIHELAVKIGEWTKDPKNIWLKDFALENGMHWTQLTRLAEKNEELSVALKMAKDWQESKLFKMGTSKKFNPAMPIFALKNVAGWRDRQEFDMGETAFEFLIGKKKSKN